MATTNVKTTTIAPPAPLTPKRNKMPKSKAGTEMTKSVK
jgi:hypothetical protein